jgi:hypothetical protein
VNSGAAVTAIENIASVMTLVANLFMHFSWFPFRRSTRDGHGIEPPTVPDIPGFSRLFWEDSVPISAQHAGHNVALQHNQIVIQMNGVLHFTSGRVQCRPPIVVSMIDEPGCSAGDFAIPFEQETIMLKTISAALLAASVLTAPVLAAQSTTTTANAPITKTTQTKTAVKSTDAKAIHGKTIHRKPVQSAATPAKPAVLNANAKMDKHHHKHLSYHHRHHGKMSALKSQRTAQTKTTFKTTPKVSLKPAAATTKRG